MRYIPHDYQKKCIYAIIRKNNIALFLDMGLGKTVITLSAFYTLKYYNKINNCLVIATKKVAESVWKQEANKWEHLKNLKFSLILGSEKKRKEALNTEADVYIINRENTEWLSAVPCSCVMDLPDCHASYQQPCPQPCPQDQDERRKWSSCDRKPEGDIQKKIRR